MCFLSVFLEEDNSLKSIVIFDKLTVGEGFIESQNHRTVGDGRDL